MLSVYGIVEPEFEAILCPGALRFLTDLHTRFNDRRLRLLEQRRLQQTLYDAGIKPGFLEKTKHVRDSDWVVNTIPEALQDRRVEITGPPTRKLVVNALNCGSRCYMADFEDSLSPTFHTLLDGQLNLKDAVHRRIDFVHKGTGKAYRLNETVGTLLVRPRGLHLDESHILDTQGKPLSGSLMVRLRP